MNPSTTMTREQIARDFGLFGTIIAASTADTERRRTAYFYRREAIEWGRMARQRRHAGVCKRLAMHYLNLYRVAKAAK